MAAWRSVDAFSQLSESKDTENIISKEWKQGT